MRAVAPGVELGVRVGSWFSALNSVPSGRALICSCSIRFLDFEPTYATSSVMACHSLCWTPTFHAVTWGGVKS